MVRAGAREQRNSRTRASWRRFSSIFFNQDWKDAICESRSVAPRGAAAALGVNVLKYKLIAISSSAFFAALAGTFYAQYYGFIDPSIVFASSISVEAIVPCIIGGSGTLYGPLLGALLIIPLQEICNSLFTSISGINMIVYGVLIVLFIMFCPDGIYGRMTKYIGKRKGE